MASPNLAAREVLVPVGYALTSRGISIHGDHALDAWAYLREDGNIHVSFEFPDPLVGNIYAIPPKPEYYVDTWLDWAMEWLWEMSDGRLVPLQRSGQVDVLRLVLGELDTLRWERNGHGQGDIGALLYPGFPVEIRQLLGHMSTYLSLIDNDQVAAVLAAATAKVLATDPLWLMLVMSSASGKNETLRLADNVIHTRFSDMTLAGLISRKGGKTTGMLAGLNGKDALATITDFSTMLGDNRKSGEAKTDVFNALREIYDGQFVRTMHGGDAKWQGRLSLLAACTPAIDRFTAHADALGTRWLYFRGIERNVHERKYMAQMAARREKLGEKRATATQLATDIILAAQERIHETEFPPKFATAIEDMAVLVGYGRASIPRETWGSREIMDIIDSELPGRVTLQLRSFGLGLLALGIEEETALGIVRRAALSSMPLARAKVLPIVASAPESPSTYRVAAVIEQDLKVTQRALEDWEAIGVMESETTAGEKLQPTKKWRITRLYADLVATALLEDEKDD